MVPNYRPPSPSKRRICHALPNVTHINLVDDMSSSTEEVLID
jgi:hypothetical protein